MRQNIEQNPSDDSAKQGDHARRLAFCALHGNAEELAALLQAGASAQCSIADGSTPLMFAASSNSSACALLLALSGARADARNVFGENACHWIAKGCDNSPEWEAACRALSQAQGFADALCAKDATGRTPRQLLPANASRTAFSMLCARPAAAALAGAPGASQPKTGFAARLSAFFTAFSPDAPQAPAGAPNPEAEAPAAAPALQNPESALCPETVPQQAQDAAPGAEPAPEPQAANGAGPACAEQAPAAAASETPAAAQEPAWEELLGRAAGAALCFHSDVLKAAFSQSASPQCAAVRVPWLRDADEACQQEISELVMTATGRRCEAVSYEAAVDEFNSDYGRSGQADAAIRANICKRLAQGVDIALLFPLASRVPQILQELCSSSAEIPRFTRESAAEAFRAFHKAEAAPALPDGAWHLLAPSDIAMTAGAPAENAAACLGEILERKTKAKKPAGSLPLESLVGLGEARDWALRLIDDLKAASAGQLAWDEVDRGALLEGAPGTGKTSIARAIAASGGVALHATTATSWMSAGSLDDVLQAMNEDFERAAQASPGILFIDEIDAIGSRQSGGAQHDQWVSWTVNHLLALIDGFDKDRKIVLLAATNNSRQVDPALLRSGRLDRLIQVPKPTVGALESIWRHYLAGAACSMSDADYLEAAQNSFGATGADIERFAREARRSARLQKQPVQLAHALAAIHQTPLSDGGSPADPEELRKTALHEAGHALAELLSQDGGARLRYASILPRADGVLGFVMSCDTDPNRAMSRRQCHERLRVLLAGRAAEELRLGAEEITTGCSSDLAAATSLARSMIGSLGLGNSGRLSVALRDDKSVEEQTEQLLQELYAQTLSMLSDNGAALDAIAGALLSKGEISGQGLRDLAKAHLAQPSGERP